MSYKRNKLTLYHQTSPTAAASIIKSSKMRCGTQGIAGGGIYFARTAAETQNKAHHTGVILQCSVRTGYYLTKPGNWYDHHYSLSKLQSEHRNAECVRILRAGGIEYVVYRPSQVRILACQIIGSNQWFNCQNLRHNTAALRCIENNDAAGAIRHLKHPYNTGASRTNYVQLGGSGNRNGGNGNGDECCCDKQDMVTASATIITGVGVLAGAFFLFMFLGRFICGLFAQIQDGIANCFHCLCNNCFCNNCCCCLQVKRCCACNACQDCYNGCTCFHQSSKCCQCLSEITNKQLSNCRGCCG